MCPPEEEENNGSTPPKRANRVYSGMAYTDLSKAGAEIIKKAHETGNWHGIIEDLIEIRLLMKHQKG
jgi:hypothetical protein